MIGKLNHIAIAVPNLLEAANTYKNILGAKVGAPIKQQEHGVTVIFVDLPNSKLELISPLGERSPIENFLKKNPNGGIHHICFEVGDIQKSIKKLKNEGAQILGTGEAKIGAHGKPVVFLHPKDFNGTLIELEEI